jgi:hypothetical protein
MSIEQAAAAFDADMGRSVSTVVKDPKQAPAEPIFSNLGDMEVDDDSPARGGGDDAPTAEELRARGKKSQERQPPKADEDDAYEGFTDEELEALGMDPRPKGDEESDEDEDDQGDEKRGEGDDEDEDELLAREFTVMVDGEETKVSIKDALKNYSHREAVDRRMNFVEQGKLAVAEEARNVMAARSKVIEQLTEAEEILKALLPVEPNWDELFAKDPVNARNLQKQYEMFQGKIEEIRGKRSKVEGEGQQQDVSQTVAYRNTEAKKFFNIAKWDNAKARDKDLASMTRTALSTGFSEDEVKQVLDSRMLHILLKASKYDRMMAARPKPTNTRQQQKPASPGAPRTRTAPKGNDRAVKHLQRTGSIDAAIPVFADILKRSR